MSQKSESGRKGSSVAIVIISLITGAVVVLLLLVLRTNEQGLKTESRGTAPQTAAAAALELRVFNSEEIQQWIAAKMKQAGAKVAVVNIWATWCAPCRDEMPELVRYRKTGQAPLFLISADNEVDESLVRTFLVESGADFESSLVKGDHQKFVETWQSLSSKDPARRWSMTLPATFLINASGQVLSFSVGTHTAAELTAMVKMSLDTPHD